MNLLKAFFYSNSCALCVWARYCLFFLIGVHVHTRWPDAITSAITSVAWFLLVFLIVLAIIPEKSNIKTTMKEIEDADT